MSDCDCGIKVTNQAQFKTLLILLAINGVMFLVEVITGVYANSTGLIADSLDMLADAVVYGISIYALGKSQFKKIRAAMVSGIFQMTLAGLVIVDVIKRFIVGSEPQSILIMGIGTIALVANICCLWLIAQHRQGEVHMRASWIFSRNDVIANLGVILAGLLVNLFNSRFPDLIIGVVITFLVFLGGIEIMRDARRERLNLRSGM